MPFFTGYLAQGVGSSAAFTENTAAGYARAPVIITDLANGGCSLASPSYNQNTTAAVVTQRALYDASTGGNLIMWWNLLNPVALTTTSIDRIRAGALSHTFPALQGGAGTGASPIDFLAGQRIGSTSDGNPVMAGTAVEVKNGVVAALTLGGSGGGAPTGAAGGDLSGNYPNPSVAKVSGTALGTAAYQNSTAFQPAGTPVVSNVALVSTGSTHTATANSTVGWNSSTASAKAETIPGAATANAGQDIVVKDVIGTAGTYSITVTPVSGTVEGASSLSLNVNNQSVTLRSDGTSNWMII